MDGYLDFTKSDLPKNWGPLTPQRPELLLKDFGATKGWEEDLPCVSHKTQCGVNLGLQLIGWLAAALRLHAISFLWYRAEVLKVFPVGNLAGAPDSQLVQGMGGKTSLVAGCCKGWVESTCDSKLELHLHR